MQLTIEPKFESLEKTIHYTDKIYLSGSCFAQNLHQKLDAAKLKTACNTHGILFNPISIMQSINEIIECKIYTENDLFFYNDLWHSWHHHGSFSHIDKNVVLQTINQKIAKDHSFLKGAQWIIITLGSAYNYNLKIDHINSKPVANCHKYPQQNFDKKLLEIEALKASIDPCYHRLKQFNPNIKIIFTVSPVRYLKDGIIENNRSKARLIEIAHHFCSKFTDVFYFPAYEIVVDILRDYRFFAEDFAHPTPQAIQYVYEQFLKIACNKDTQIMLLEMAALQALKAHKPLHKGTKEFAAFLETKTKKETEIFNKYGIR